MKYLKLCVLTLFAVAIAPPVRSIVQIGTLSAPEAPTGFDNLTNGFVNQPEFNRAKASFEDVEQIADGLGPVYNAQSCRECDQNPVTGAISQIKIGRAHV